VGISIRMKNQCGDFLVNPMTDSDCKPLRAVTLRNATSYTCIIAQFFLRGVGGGGQLRDKLHECLRCVTPLEMYMSCNVSATLSVAKSRT